MTNEEREKRYTTAKIRGELHMLVNNLPVRDVGKLLSMARSLKTGHAGRRKDGHTVDRQRMAAGERSARDQH